MEVLASAKKITSTFGIQRLLAVERMTATIIKKIKKITTTTTTKVVGGNILVDDYL